MRRLFLILSLSIAVTASAADDWKLIAERQSLTATWRTYRQVIDGLDVYGTDVIQRVDADGSVHEMHRTSAVAAGHRPLLASAQARGSLPAGRIASESLVAVNVSGEARPAYRFVVEEEPLRPVAHFVDAATGAVIRREPLYFNVKARVFDVNPVAKLNRPDLQDQNNDASAVPAEAYSDVDLDNLQPSGMLTGPNVSIVDTQAPFNTPHADASQSLIFDRSQPQFEEVNAYFQLDRNQKYLQSLGYIGPRRIVAYSIPVDPHAASGTDNSFYISNATNGTGALFFGDGGTDDAEDSDIMLHEYGHAIQDWIAPGAFTGESNSQGRAMGEGFGDYWSFSSTYAATTASGRDPFCIADWDARCGNDDPSQSCGYAKGADCLRRVDSTKTMANYFTVDSPGTEHQNGEIWSSALREIFLVAGKRVTDTIVLEATFGVPANPTFAAVAQRMLDADRSLYGGAHAATICGAMTKRGILSDCSAMPRGDVTFFEGLGHGLPIPDNNSNGVTSTAVVNDTRTIDRLLVRVDIQHQSRGDLLIVLVGPDGTSIVLQNPSLDRGADLHGTFGIDIEPATSLDAFKGKSANGTWKLIVSDTRAGATGTLISWALDIRFTGDQPFDVRPFSFANRLHVPAVAHTDGLAGSQWRSDVFLFNKSSSAAANVTLLFTPSGANGALAFGAVRSVIGPEQVVAFRDVVASLFQTTGGGTLEIQGDVQQMQAWSATYDASRGLSESVDVVSSSDAFGINDPPEYLVPIAINADRVNVGVVETAGESGTVTITAQSAIFSVATITLTVAPFSHVQVPLTLPGAPIADSATVRVTAGNARIAAYASLIRGGSGDPMYVPARRADGGTMIVPVVADTHGLGGAEWVSDRDSVNFEPSHTKSMTETFFAADGTSQQRAISLGGSYTIDLLLSDFSRDTGIGQVEMEIPPGTITTTRLATFALANSVGDRIEPIPKSDAIGTGDTADAIRIENDPAFRTNVGFAEVAGESAVVRVTLFDAAGQRVGAIDETIGPRGWLQVPLAALSTTPIVDGRVRFEVLSGGGRILGYASVVNNTSGDASFVRAR